MQEDLEMGDGTGWIDFRSIKGKFFHSVVYIYIMLFHFTFILIAWLFLLMCSGLLRVCIVFYLELNIECVLGTCVLI